MALSIPSNNALLAKSMPVYRSSSFAASILVLMVSFHAFRTACSPTLRAVSWSSRLRSLPLSNFSGLSMAPAKALNASVINTWAQPARISRMLNFIITVFAVGT